jgi:hypothetical protein
LNAIQAFLKNIIRARFEIVFVPATQAVLGVAVGILVISTQSFERSFEGFAV